MTIKSRSGDADTAYMPDQKPVCPNCGADAAAMGGRVDGGTLIREWVCAKCRAVWPFDPVSTTTD